MQVTTTISRGRLAYADGEVKVKERSGRFVQLPAFVPAVYKGLEADGQKRMKEMFPYGSIPVRLVEEAQVKDEL